MPHPLQKSTIYYVLVPALRFSRFVKNVYCYGQEGPIGSYGTPPSSLQLAPRATRPRLVHLVGCPSASAAPRCFSDAQVYNLG